MSNNATINEASKLVFSFMTNLQAKCSNCQMESALARETDNTLAGLFTPEADIETCSLSTLENKHHKPLAYMEALRSCCWKNGISQKKYTTMVFEFKNDDPVYIETNRNISDGSSRIVFKIRQSFWGYNKNNMLYHDYTVKQVTVLVKKNEYHLEDIKIIGSCCTKS